MSAYTISIALNDSILATWTLKRELKNTGAQPPLKVCAYAGVESSHSLTTGQCEPSERYMANDDLCNLCLEALTIDDEAAGGSVWEHSNGVITLNLSGFALDNRWLVSSNVVIRDLDSRHLVDKMKKLRFSSILEPDLKRHENGWEWQDTYYDQTME
ncbi:predicted protein [Sclerotinia sclerotiorum 1980 UF-70]|uniref:Uncharacterized protein n=1 Tax=Sclerotinia sclerotiorum (strain ATCC 18683 / 1980 / Ss-1) TaxID=665079 RepID=A7EDL5_SCLS1|nr:predicted protein [Sclerotinia sclerotiorum 1980 UF-70]EDO00931.1 predicted protein [Sclerotinia sclerotiorum 1980 UF-70]